VLVGLFCRQRLPDSLCFPKLDLVFSGIKLWHNRSCTHFSKVCFMAMEDFTEGRRRPAVDALDWPN